MHEFKLWAPNVKQVSVVVGETVSAMSGPDGHGWWRGTVEAAGHGTDYCFRLDDDMTNYPDPRSQWQPNGVHGMSRLYDQSAFNWHDSRWQAPPFGSAILYELHIGTFTQGGTFDSAIERLDYLRDLGITHIEVMPVAAYAGDRGWGYDGVSLFAVTENYGGPDGLKRFVDACHVRGLAVVLDVVYNHFGPVGAYANRFGPYLTGNHCTPWGDAVNFESAGSDQVRRFFCDNALFWVRDFHIDGLRLDAVHEFVDRSAVHFLEQLAAEVEVMADTLGRRVVLIAESDLNDPKIVRPREGGGYGIDAQWSDDFHHSLFTLLHSDKAMGYYDDFGSFEKLVKALTRIFVYDGIYSQYRKRSHGRPIDGLSAHHFVGFIQNHDQVGNRALGERLEHLIGIDLAKIGAGIVLTAPMVPLLFQGEEFAASTPFLYFADHEDEAMAKAVAEGRKKEFAAFGFGEQEVPNPELRETFERSILKWQEVDEGRHKEMLDWYRALIHLRRNSTWLNDGDKGHLRVDYDDKELWLRVDRVDGQVLINLGKDASTFRLGEEFKVVLSSRDGVNRVDDGVSVPPCTLAIAVRERPD